MKLTREIKTAILVIASILLFIWGYSFLQGRDLLTNYKILYAKYENVEGLVMSSPVTINGFVVGKVRTIILDNKTGKLVVEMQITSDFPISKSSQVNIYEPGLIGGKQIQIIPNLEDPNLAQTGDYLNSGVVPGLTSIVGDRLSPLQDKIEKAVVSADSVLVNINALLDPATKAHFKASMANLNATLLEFKGASKNVNAMLAENRSKIGSAVSNFDKTSKNLAKVSDSLANINFNKSVRSLENSLAKVNNLMTDIESGKGTLGKLMTDDKVYDNLEGASRELEQLLSDLKRNPKRYVHFSLFGKKAKEYEPLPEDEKVEVEIDTTTTTTTTTTNN